MTSSLDLNATMLDALECPPLPHSRGRSLLPLLEAPGAVEWEDIAFSEFCLDEAGAAGPVAGEVVQRMVRRGPWKLNYYDGQPCQLFHLEEDPRETRDRAADPSCAGVRAELEGLVLDGWDPAWVREQMARRRAEGRILAEWGRRVQPADVCRWDLRPEMDYLD